MTRIEQIILLCNILLLHVLLCRMFESGPSRESLGVHVDSLAAIVAPIVWVKHGHMLVLRAWVKALTSQWHILDHLLVLDEAVDVGVAVLFADEQWLLGLLVAPRPAGHLLLKWVILRAVCATRVTLALVQAGTTLRCSLVWRLDLDLLVHGVSHLRLREIKGFTAHSLLVDRVSLLEELLLLLKHHGIIALVSRLLVIGHFRLTCLLAGLSCLALVLLRRLLMVLVFQEGFPRDAWHDQVIFMLLLATERPRSALMESLHATLILNWLLRLLLVATLLLLEVHDLLDLVLHLHDCIHHGHFCRRSLLLVRRQAHLHKLQLLPQKLILLNQSLTMLRLVTLIWIIANRTCHIN